MEKKGTGLGAYAKAALVTGGQTSYDKGLDGPCERHVVLCYPKKSPDKESRI